MSSIWPYTGPRSCDIFAQRCVSRPSFSPGSGGVLYNTNTELPGCPNTLWIDGATWLSLASALGVLDLLGTLLRVPLQLASLKHPAGLGAIHWLQTPQGVRREYRKLGGHQPGRSLPLFAGTLFRAVPALFFAHSGRHPWHCAHESAGATGRGALVRREESAGPVRNRTPGKGEE